MELLSSLSAMERSRLLGDVLTLMTASDAHQGYKVKHFPAVVLCPLQLNQFRIYHDADKRPVGFVSWACFSKKVEERFLNGNPTLSLEDWYSGDIIYFMEFIAPFGHIKQMVKDLREHFRGKTTHAVRFDGDRLENKQVSVFYGYSNQ